MTGEKFDLCQEDWERLATIQKELIEPAILGRINCDIVIKIRDGRINFSEAILTNRNKIIFVRK